jgi:signal peptidase I
MQPALHVNDRFVANHNNGDSVKIQNNTLYVNDNPQEEPYIQDKKTNLDFPSVTIPIGAFFTLGDNRANSHDSRSMGPIPKKDIIGKALYIFFEKGHFVFANNL